MSDCESLSAKDMLSSMFIKYADGVPVRDYGPGAQYAKAKQHLHLPHTKPVSRNK